MSVRVVRWAIVGNTSSPVVLVCDDPRLADLIERAALEAGIQLQRLPDPVVSGPVR